MTDKPPAIAWNPASAIGFVLMALIPGLFRPYATAAQSEHLQQSDTIAEISAEVVRDKIRGGLLGQILGNLNGLPHEMKYIAEPGNVVAYTPALPDGARTDDDTDLEWVYIVEMQQQNRTMLPPERIVRLWKERINDRIWCSNQYARQLMDIGIDPPLTGSIVLNPWADFNISGQFVCETFGLLAPGMPQTAARLGLNYTTVTISGEPAQTTQLFTAMIATAFVSDDLDTIIEAGLAAIDPDCRIRQIVEDVRRWHDAHPENWRTTRNHVKSKYSRHNGAMRDRNGYELNTASTIAALLYGNGDFTETLKTAFNFGWDADNNAATSGTIIGVTKGYRWMMSQGWKIVDRYRNTTRDNMPDDETITSFADRLIALAESVIVQNGGLRHQHGARSTYRIKVQQPASILPIRNRRDEAVALRGRWDDWITQTVRHSSDKKQLARAAYMAICLDLSDNVHTAHPDRWRMAIVALEQFPKLIEVLFFHSPVAAGDRLREKAIAAGLEKPDKRVKLW